MTFVLMTFAVAILISTISAFYSVLGLTAIFAGAFWPIVIMTGGLEVGKIVSALWLHKYWKQAEFQYKLYLSTAVIILMLLTSMGVFGFLSAAHVSQSVPSSDVLEKVKLFDEKIIIQRENIEVARKALQQLNIAVDQVVSRTTDENGAMKSSNLRKSQSKERTQLQNEISKAQNEIVKLQEERSPIASNYRKIESDIGPLKYLAAFVYGDNPDANILEKAVRWVIILIVCVFDPLAITLLLAATKSLEWERVKKQKIALLPAANQSREWESENLEDEIKRAEEAVDFHLGPDDSVPVSEQIEEIVLPPIETMNKYPDINQDTIMPVQSNTVNSNDTASEPVNNVVPEPVEEIIEEEMPIIEEVQTTLEIPEPNKYTGEYVTYEGRHMHRDALKVLRPELFLTTTTTRPISTNFGATFPLTAIVGDIFVRIDVIPNKVFKFNGSRWIEVNKQQTVSYIDHAYLKHLVSKIESGEYDVEMLTDGEKQHVEEFLKNSKTI